MKKIVHVAAAVITRPDGSVLLGQRAPDTFYPGYWEFPGGKVEPGETPRDALIRELDEELGMRVDAAYPWITREHVYEHAHVSLHFFEVTAWRGEIHDRVHSALSWQQAGAMDVGPMLPANGPILKALRLPRVCGITHAGEIGIDAQLARLEAALAGGLRLVQIREPALPDADCERFARAVVERCHAAGALAVVNGDAALARRIGADGVHLGEDDGDIAAARTLLGPGAIIGASCYDHLQLAQRAVAAGASYVAFGAFFPSRSKATTRRAHPQLLRDATALGVPRVAIGGLTADNSTALVEAGADLLAVISGVFAADDPLAALCAYRACFDVAPTPARP